MGGGAESKWHLRGGQLRALLASNKDDEPGWRLLWTKLCSPPQRSHGKAHNPLWHLGTEPLGNNWV